jgi:mannose/fructose/N-acetylgalactosamine-specific phosphotransferase system component IIC
LNSLDAFVIVGVTLMVGSLLAYPIWFANSLRRARAKLGSPAVWLATTVCISLAATVIMCVWTMVVVITTPGFEHMADEAIDELLAPYLQRFSILGCVLELAVATCMAWLLLAGRRRLMTPEVTTPEAPPSKSD